MADKKISQLTDAATPIAGTEELPIVQSGVTKKVAVINLIDGLSTISVTKGGTGTSTAFTAGSAVFAGASGVYSQDNDNFFWDNSNKRLGIGTKTPTATINVFNPTLGSTAGDKSDAIVLNNIDGNNVSFRAGNYRIANGSGAGNNRVVLQRVTDNVAFESYVGFENSNVNIGVGTTEVMRAFVTGGVSVGDTADPGAGNLRLGTGNLVIGTSGKGIDFSATGQAAGMTSELLDDYEEGTWTPTDASGAGLTFSNVDASYTKIGRMVHAYCRVGYPVTANGNAAIIGGLPFTVQNAQGARQARFTYTNQTNATFVFPTPNSTQAVLFNASGAVTNAQMSTSDNWIMFSYPV